MPEKIPAWQRQFSATEKKEKFNAEDAWDVLLGGQVLT
jgi:hypothetical protein